MAFLPKFSLSDYNCPVLVYRNSEAIDLVDELVASEYAKELLSANEKLISGRKVVFILWQNEERRMADVWLFGKDESEVAGAEVSVYLFDETTPYDSPIVMAVDGLLVLAEEAKQL